MQTIKLLSTRVNNYNNQLVPVPVDNNVGSPAARVRDLFRMNTPEFLGSDIGQDPQNIID